MPRLVAKFGESTAKGVSVIASARTFATAACVGLTLALGA